MPINVSGGMANARAYQLKQEKLKRRARKDKPEDEFEEEATFTDVAETKLGKFLKFIDPIIVILIILNAIQMGVATFNFVEDNEKLDSVFELVDQLFLIIFTVEVSLNFIHFNRLDRIQFIEGKPQLGPITAEAKENWKEDLGWLVFDALVVIFSWAFAQMSIIRAFRILRLLRLIKKVENLKNVVGALISIMPKMGVVAFMLTIFFLIFGIAFTDMFGDLYDRGYYKHDYFGSLDLTFFTLFHVMTFDSWQGVARATMVVYPSAWILFILWNVVTGFVIMNLIIAIICESLVKLTEKKKIDKELAEEEERRNAAKDMASSLTRQGSTNSMYSVEYIEKISDCVEDILVDQELLAETVDKLRVALEDVLDDSPKAHNIRKILMSLPTSLRL